METDLSIAYWNGEWMPLSEVRVSPLDRGFLFADGVYEVVPVFGGRPFLLDRHLQRLENSLAKLNISIDTDVSAFRQILEGLLEKNQSENTLLYLQISRGADTIRNHSFPKDVSATVFAMCSALHPHPADLATRGVAAITRPDTRWARCDIKSISLLPNILAREEATQAGAAETIFIRDGKITEATSSNVFAVSDGILITPPEGNEILPGITRSFVLDLAKESGTRVEQRPLPEAEFRKADEVWITSSSKEIWPVTLLDGLPVGNGNPGPVWLSFFDHYQAKKDSLS